RQIPCYDRDQARHQKHIALAHISHRMSAPSPARPDLQFWRGRRVLVTGHTGFKGGWLALWLKSMGADVTGYALSPEHGDGIFTAASVGNGMTPVTGDIRDLSRLSQCISLMRPEIVFHLAAQALVRRAHRDPHTTYATNVTGTAKVLDAAKAHPF